MASVSKANPNDLPGAMRTLSQEEVQSACGYKLCDFPWQVYGGWFGTKHVAVHVLGPDDLVANVARKMHSVSHRHVAKFVGWCEEIRSIVVEGDGSSLQALIRSNALSWHDCRRIAHQVASAAAYLDSQTDGGPVRIDPALVWLDSYKTLHLVYIPGGSDGATGSFGRMLKDMVEGPLRDSMAVSATLPNDYLKTRLDLLGGLDEVADRCALKGDPASMEEIAAKVTHIAEKAKGKMEESLKGICALSEKQVEDSKIEETLSDAFRGVLEDTPVLVLDLNPSDNVDIMPDVILDYVSCRAWEMHSVNHPHVAKVVGLCRESKNIVVKGGERERGSLGDRIVQGLAWQDCCRIANQVADAVLYLVRQGIRVDIWSALIIFDEMDNSKLVHLPSEFFADRSSYLFGWLLREMLMGPLWDPDVESQDDLKANLDPRVNEWPTVVIEELTGLASKCFRYGAIMEKMDITSMEEVAGEMSRISQVALAVELELVSL